MKLMIVESPNKIKKISGFLGPGWKVAASIGHIRDLPKNEMGVSPPDFTPEYVITPDKKKVVSNLRSLSRQASEVYLATDPDREGEAIAFHLKECLGLKSPKRAVFKEITQAAILNSIKHAGTIDEKLVAAQESRRVLDRIVGYTISALLSRQAGVALSAGRVQSPAVKLTVLREKAISDFTSRSFYGVEISLANGIIAQLEAKEWCEDGKHIFDKQTATMLSTVKTVIVSKSLTQEKSTKPRPPFTTSALQQSCSTNLGLSPSLTMQLAQGLFEQGLITYHRTDSPNLSAAGFELAVEFLGRQKLPVQTAQLKWNSGDIAQEAHEAIRPTDFSVTNTDDFQQNRVYELIRERALASAMAPAIDVVTDIELVSCEEYSMNGQVSHAKFKVSGKVEKFKGWRGIIKLEQPSDHDSKLSAILAEGEKHTVQGRVVEKLTQPPARFTEASLIKALEKLKIGRPSTYASILENIKTRNYIEVGGAGRKKDQIAPTETGKMIVMSLNSMTFMNLDYTRILEETLDKIAAGKADYLRLVGSVYQTLHTEIPGIKIESMVETVPCPACGEDLRRLKSKKRNKKSLVFFWVHLSETTECSRFIDDHQGKPVLSETKASDCPSCGELIARKFSNSRNFYFWVHENPIHSAACSNYIPDSEGKPVAPTTNENLA